MTSFFTLFSDFSRVFLIISPAFFPILGNLSGIPLLNIVGNFCYIAGSLQSNFQFHAQYVYYRKIMPQFIPHYLIRLHSRLSLSRDFFYSSSLFDLDLFGSLDSWTLDSSKVGLSRRSLRDHFSRPLSTTLLQWRVTVRPSLCVGFFLLLFLQHISKGGVF